MAPGRAGSKELSAFADQIILSDCYRIVKYFLWEMFDFLKIMGVYSAAVPSAEESSRFRIFVCVITLILKYCDPLGSFLRVRGTLFSQRGVVFRQRGGRNFLEGGTLFYHCN